VTFVLIVWAGQEEMLDCLRGKASTVGTGGGFRVVDVEDVLIKGGVACAELDEKSGLVVVEVFDKFEKLIQWEGFVKGVDEAVAGESLPALFSFIVCGG